MRTPTAYKGRQIMRAHEEVAPVACDDCGAPADSAHLLPDDLRPKEVRYACPEHDPGGYCFSIRPDGLPTDDWMLHHLAKKNAETVITYMRRIQREQIRRRSEWRAALDRMVGAEPARRAPSRRAPR